MTSSGEEKEKGPQEEKNIGDTLPKIMTKPLPMILDELENYIRRVEEAVKQAQAAAKESREAAEEARLHGEKAAEAAKKAAEDAVTKVKEEAARAADTLGARVSDIEAQLKALTEKVDQEANAVDRAFLALKDKHTEESPFLSKK